MLTEKEKQIFTLLAADLSQREVAQRVFVSPKTLEKIIARKKEEYGCKRLCTLLLKINRVFPLPIEAA